MKITIFLNVILVIRQMLFIPDSDVSSIFEELDDFVSFSSRKEHFDSTLSYNVLFWPSSFDIIESPVTVGVFLQI